MELLEHIDNTKSKTGKIELGYFEEFYDQIMSPRKNTCDKILEIGVYHGDSILLWRSFFTNATIYGVDINKCRVLDNKDRVKLYQTDAYKKDFVSKFEKNSFDFVIDDGPHTLSTMKFFLENYLDLVKVGGFLILEDIIESSWTPILLKCIDQKHSVKVYDMRNKVKTPELLRRWKNGLDVIIVEKK